MTRRVLHLSFYSVLALQFALFSAGNMYAQQLAAPDALIARGDDLLRAGDYREAEQAYREALRLDSHANGAEIGLARVALEDEQWDDAILLLNNVLDRDTANLEAHYLRGISHREVAKYRTVNQTHHWNAARRDFEAVVARDSAHIDVLYQYALLERYHDAFPEAIALAAAQVRIRPDLPEPQHLIFKLYRSFINSTDSATVNAWLRAHPSDYAAYFIGEKMRREGDLIGAARRLDGLLRRPLDVPRQRILLSRARVAYALGQAEQAERYVRQAVDSIAAPYEADLVFDDFKYVVNEAELEQYRRLQAPEEYRAFFEALWAKRDPTPARSYNVRLAEHYRRVLKAEQEFAFEGFRIWHNNPDRRGELTYPVPYDLNDEFNDKGLIYIRHGEPAERVFFAGGQGGFGVMQGDQDIYSMPSEYSYTGAWRPMESWRYRDPAVDFHFTVAEAASVDNWRLTPEILNAEMLENLEHWGPPYSEMLAAIRSMEQIQGSKTTGQFTPIARSADEEQLQEQAEEADTTRGDDEASSRLGSVRYTRDFMDFNTARKRMVEESRAAVDLGLTTDRHTWSEDTEPIEMPHLFAAFRGAGGRTEVELHYALPIGRISRTVDSGAGTVEVELGYAVHDGAWHEVAGEASPRRLPTTPDETAAVVDLFRFSAPPDSYQVALYSHPTGTEKLGGVRVPYQVPAFADAGLALSDLLLAERIEPAAGESRFNRGNFHISPNPFLRFSTRQPVFVYFEVYNLTYDAGDRTRYTVEYTLMPEEERGLFGRANRPALALRADRSSEERSPVEWAEIDVSKVPPGNYHLNVRITNELTGETREQSRPLALYEYK